MERRSKQIKIRGVTTEIRPLMLARKHPLPLNLKRKTITLKQTSERICSPLPPRVGLPEDDKSQQRGPNNQLKYDKTVVIITIHPIPSSIFTKDHQFSLAFQY
jgi:hypothetical protein